MANLPEEIQRVLDQLTDYAPAAGISAFGEETR